MGDRVEEFAEQWTDDPERLIGPITSIGLNVAGVLAALVLILITAYYMAVSPDPLVDGLSQPGSAVAAGPRARPGPSRLRVAWIGWMQGVGVDMIVTGVLVYIGLVLIGLDFAIFFAVLSALLVVMPYFGAIAGAIPPVLFALTDSPGKALLVLVAYVAVQQVEGNVTIPMVMSQSGAPAPGGDRHRRGGGRAAVRRPGLFVAVPILSLLVITVDEFWVKQIEESRATAKTRRHRASAHARGRRSREPERGGGSGQLRDRDHRADQDEDHDQELQDDPEAGRLHALHTAERVAR